jgi:hypothetical protein
MSGTPPCSRGRCWIDPGDGLVSAILTASAIFVGLLPNLLILVLTFLTNTKGDPSDQALQLRKQFMREIVAHVSFSLALPPHAGLGGCAMQAGQRRKRFDARAWGRQITPTMRRADSVQPHLRATSAQAILKNVGGRFAAWQNLSTD